MENLTKEQIEEYGIVEGATIKGIAMKNLMEKHQYQFPESEIIKTVNFNEDDQIWKITTDFTESVKTINDKEVEDSERKWELSDLSMIEVVRDIELPKTVCEADFEATKDMFDFEFTSIPKDLVKSFKDVFMYLNSHKEEIDEFLDLDEIKLNVDGLEIPIKELELLYLGIDKIKGSNEFEGLKTNVFEEESNTESIPIDVDSLPPLEGMV